MFVDLWKDGHYLGKVVHTTDRGIDMDIRGPVKREDDWQLLEDLFHDPGYRRSAVLARFQVAGRSGTQAVEPDSAEWLAYVALFVLPEAGFRAMIDTAELTWSEYSGEQVGSAN